MEPNVDRMLDYCSSIASEFDARLNRIRTYIANHHPSAGAANEMILRDFLAELTTTRYAVGQGFICDPTAPDLVSKQCDILVYDHHQYPLVYSVGEIKVVFPASVKMMIEVKTGLDKEKLHIALDNINSCKKMNRWANGILFAFQSPSVRTVSRHLQKYIDNESLSLAPTAILLLDQGTIIHRWTGNSESGGGENPYVVSINHARRQEAVIAYLLLLFFDVLMLGAWGGASITNMEQALLSECDSIPLSEYV